MSIAAFRRWLLAVALVLVGSGAVQAQTCTFSATAINFGAVDTLGSGAINSAGTITASCSAFVGLLSSMTMTINVGEGRGGAIASTRQMTSLATATPLNFQLYRDAARTQVFGSNYWAFGGAPITVSGSSLTTLSGGGSAVFNVFGRVAGGQATVVPGSYQSVFDRNPLDVRVDYRTCNLLLFCTNRTATFTFTVSATVAANCLVSATNLGFGAVGVLSTNVDAASQINVTCTPLSAYNIGLNYGQHSSAPGVRNMQSGAGSRVLYGIYQNAGRTQPWGTLADGIARAASGLGSSQAFPVFGRVPPQATPPPGLYSDTIIVTVTY